MRRIFKGIDKQLLFLFVVLFAFGVVMIYSASNVTAFYVYDASASRYFVRQSIILLFGAILFFVAIKIPTKNYYKLAKFSVLVIIFLLIATLLYSTATNGSKNWLDIGFISIQPSEFAKIAIIPFIALFYSNHKDEKDIKFYYPFFIILLIFVLIVLENDYGTALVFAATSFFTLLFSQISRRIKIRVAILGAIAVLLLLVIVFAGVLPESKMVRLRSNKDPCVMEKYLNEGNQQCNSYIAINSGGFFGKGLGNSTQKYLYLPEAYTDYIFAIIVEELGLIGGVALIVAYFLLILKIVKIGKKSSFGYQSCMCYAIAIYLFLHIAINLFGVMGVIPLTGIPLPFVSYGGSFAICIIAALTIIERTCYESKISKE